MLRRGEHPGLAARDRLHAYAVRHWCGTRCGLIRVGLDLPTNGELARHPAARQGKAVQDRPACSAFSEGSDDD